MALFILFLLVMMIFVCVVVFFQGCVQSPPFPKGFYLYVSSICFYLCVSKVYVYIYM